MPDILIARTTPTARRAKQQRTGTPTWDPQRFRSPSGRAALLSTSATSVFFAQATARPGSGTGAPPT